MQNPNTVDAILASILNEVQPVNFKAHLRMDTDRRLTRDHRIIVVVDLAQRFAVQAKSGLCFINPSFYVYTGQVWAEVAREKVMQFLMAASEKMGVPIEMGRYYRFVEDTIKQAGTRWGEVRQWQPDKTQINLQNGTFEINGSGIGKLRQFVREDYLLHQLPFSFDPEAQAPLWDAFLERVMPNDKLQDICAEFVGYCFTSLKIEKALMLLGSGANGKSVFFNVIKALLGEQYVSHVGLREMTEPYNRTLMAGKLLNYSSEISSHMDVELFKKMTSGEPVIAREPYGKSFTMYKYARLAFNANELPKDIEENEAYFRRFLIVPFGIIIPENERNPRLAQEIIETDLPGVFNWVLGGLARLIDKRGFSESELVREAGAKFRMRSDSVEMWSREEGWIGDPSAREALADLYVQYREFCRDNKYQILGKINFSERLERAGFEKFKRGDILFRMSKRRDDDEEPTMWPHEVEASVDAQVEEG